MTSRQVKGLFLRVPFGVWWLIGFILLFSVYEYGRILHLRPLAHHIWRQATCLSLTHEYFAGEWNLFRPGVQSLIGDQMTTGKSAGEFPLLYYIVGLIWKLTGPSEFVYRVLMLAIHAWGSWALCRLVQRLTGDRYWGIMVSLFFFTVPAVVYFAISFLTDVPALDLILVGCLAYLHYLEKGGKRQLVLGTVTFGLGMLLKLTAAMLPLTIAAAGMAALVLPRWFAWPGMDRERVRHMVKTMSVGFAATATWVGFSYYYNHVHGTEYSYQGTWAIWDITADEVSKSWEFAWSIMVHQFFSIPGYAFLLFFSFYLIRHLRSLPRAFILLLLSMLIGVVLYFLLWFIALDNHDYYFIEPLVLPITVVVIALWHMRTHDTTLFKSIRLKGAFLLVFAYQVLFAMNNIRMRQQDFTMTSWLSTSSVEREHWRIAQFWDMKGLLDIEPVARQHGIEADDLIVTAPDISVCQALYLCNQRGFNEFGGLTLHCPDLVDRAQRGAKYFYQIGKKKELQDRFESCLGPPLFVHGDIVVYDIRDLAAQ